MVLEKEHLDLAYMLMQMAEEFYPVLSAHGNTVDLQVDETLAVYGDGDKLARVFNNILQKCSGIQLRKQRHCHPWLF